MHIEVFNRWRGRSSSFGWWSRRARSSYRLPRAMRWWSPLHDGSRYTRRDGRQRLDRGGRRPRRRGHVRAV